MKILSPADSPREAERLVALGAEELYGGLLTPEWAGQYGLLSSPNRRTFPEAQVSDPGELAEMIGTAHRGGAVFSLAVNAAVYSREQYAPLARLVESALQAGADRLIVADLGLLLLARERWPGVRLHLSTLAEAANSAAVAFYRRLGAARITLPRHLPVAEIERITAASPDARFDAFILYGQCPNVEGRCTFEHDDPRRVWPCVEAYRVEGTPDDAVARGAAAAQGAWAGLNRAEACGLCGLWDLERLGVEAVKIVGRGAPTPRKEWAVRALNTLRRALADGVDRAGFLERARALSRERFSHGCSPYLCYFPEFARGGHG